MDPGDEELDDADFAVLMAAAGPDFSGRDRKAAKLSISAAETEVFADLEDLIASLPAEETMTSHDPEIEIDEESGRVVEEERNIRLRGFLYAASREKDNDYHLILGRDPSLPPRFLTVEISGLPSAGHAAFDRLQTARDVFEGFFPDPPGPPGRRYRFFLDLIPVEIEGSLFFDMTHADDPPASRPGPSTLKPFMPVIWEIHHDLRDRDGAMRTVP
jgi:hypothetical protein